MTTSFKITGIEQISIPVRDIKAAVSFYQNILELQLLFEVPNMAFFACSGIQLMLAVPEKPEFNHPSSTFYFKVENINDAFDTLSERGVSFAGKPHKVVEMNDSETWMAFFYDPDRNLHALTSQVQISRH
ncbi:VOC family protein [Paenibacillus gorillae]|uniref:VOC family protein n=1 Tax=Paenibacillus gorillae TaxID=1243662 RepID=UPI0004B5AE9E|nr:VOC family protein [Paenibacillus gorillae]